ncbi:MAG: carboxypeptidase regulatory-like domain-containing protein, partial [Bryobacteraceae bacterium]
MKGALPIAAVVALALAGAQTGFSQETRATLSGTVADASASAVAGAQLQLMNAETGVAYPAVSNQLGQYRFLFVNPGTYRLTVTIAGFRTFVREGIVLSTSEAATIDVSLQVGTQTETVTVAARAPLLDAEKADRGMVVDQKQLNELPVLSRVPILLATLTPGVVWQAQSYNIQPFSNSGLSGWSINGSISPSAEFLLDGAPNDMIYQASHSIAYIPPVDAVAEFKVITGAYDAQYGRNGGGVVSILLKSGTNAFHGSAYEFLKRSFLDANSFGNNAH